MEVKAITNYDHCLRFSVKDKRITYLNDDAAEVVADNWGNICIHIDFDEQWDGCGKTARFIYNEQWVDVILDGDNECICPSEVLKKGRFSLGVYGENLKTTTPIVITVVASILSDCKDKLPEEPTPDIYQQILSITAKASENADEAAKSCMEAVEASHEAIEALNQAMIKMETNGYLSTIKEMNKGLELKFWVGTREEYLALEEKPVNCYVHFTDVKVDDYIVEQGYKVVGGIRWYYVKRDSGRCELDCYAILKPEPDNDSLNGQKGAMYYSKPITLGFPFMIGERVVTGNAGNVCFVCNVGSGGAYASTDLRLANPLAFSDAEKQNGIPVNIVVRGTWK